MRYWLVMPAAGASRRFGQGVPKPYAPLRGRTVIEWALAPFAGDSRCIGIVVALAASDSHWSRISQRFSSVIVAPGGAERCESVRSALSVLSRRASPQDWVLVHDAARPCLADEDRDRLIQQAGAHPVGGLLAVPMADTLKRAAEDGTVEQTVDRNSLWRALTPQMFRYARLCEALDSALASRRLPTDEAQAIEWLGDRPLLVPGSATNIKITSADDLTLAEAILHARAGDAPASGAPK